MSAPRSTVVGMMYGASMMNFEPPEGTAMTGHVVAVEIEVKNPETTTPNPVKEINPKMPA